LEWLDEDQRQLYLSRLLARGVFTTQPTPESQPGPLYLTIPVDIPQGIASIEEETPFAISEEDNEDFYSSPIDSPPPNNDPDSQEESEASLRPNTTPSIGLTPIESDLFTPYEPTPPTPPIQNRNPTVITASFRSRDGTTTRITVVPSSLAEEESVEYQTNEEESAVPVSSPPPLQPVEFAQDHRDCAHCPLHCPNASPTESPEASSPTTEITHIEEIPPNVWRLIIPHRPILFNIPPQANPAVFPIIGVRYRNPVQRETTSTPHGTQVLFQAGSFDLLIDAFYEPWIVQPDEDHA
jgi:hypothetical protein